MDLPLQVIKYTALFNTTPIFFKSLKESLLPLRLERALTILLAKVTPIPGTLRSV